MFSARGFFSGTGRPCNEIFCLKGYTSRRGRGWQERSRNNNKKAKKHSNIEKKRKQYIVYTKFYFTK